MQKPKKDLLLEQEVRRFEELAGLNEDEQTQPYTYVDAPSKQSSTSNKPEPTVFTIDQKAIDTMLRKAPSVDDQKKKSIYYHKDTAISLFEHLMDQIKKGNSKTIAADLYNIFLANAKDYKKAIGYMKGTESQLDEQNASEAFDKLVEQQNKTWFLSKLFKSKETKKKQQKTYQALKSLPPNVKKDIVEHIAKFFVRPDKFKSAIESYATSQDSRAKQYQPWLKNSLFKFEE